METKHPGTEEIRQIAGRVRLLAALLRPAPNPPELDRGAVEKALRHLAADLDRVARKMEQGVHDPIWVREERWP